MIVDRFAANAVKSVAIGLLALVPSLVLPALYSRTLPAADLAAWLYAFSIATYVTAFHLGVAPALSALVSRESTDPKARAGLLLAATVLLVIAAALATATLLGLTLAGRLDAQAGLGLGEATFHRLMSLAIIGTAAIMPLHALAGYCTGIFEVGRLLPVNLLQKLSLTGFAIIAALVWRDADAVAWSHLASGLVTAVALAVIIGREIRIEPAAARMQWPRRFTALLGYSLPAALSGLAQLPLAGVHTLIVAREVPAALVPFAVLAPVLTLVAGMIWSIMSNLLPEMSATVAGKTTSKAATRRLLIRATGVLGLALIVIQIAASAGLPWFLHWALTAQWVATWADTQLVGLAAYAIALILRQLTLPMGLAFFATGSPWTGLIPTGLEALVSVMLALLWTPAFGLVGLAAAVVAGVTINALAATWLLAARARRATNPPASHAASRAATRAGNEMRARRLGIIALARPLVAGIVVSLLLAVACGAGSSAIPSSASIFSMRAAIAGIVLLAAFYALGLTPATRSAVIGNGRNLLRTIGRRFGGSAA